MWSPVSGSGSTDTTAPSARTKHSATLVGDHVYLIGGRNGNVALRDMWKYNIVEGRWETLHPIGDKPPCLQEHTAVGYKDGLFVFGGEVACSGTETPLWYYNIKTNQWRKIKAQKGVQVPRGRRGHTALIHRGSMLIYGGYEDLKGSSNELWSFHFESESWHLLSSKKSSRHHEAVPPGRHKHSAVMHDDAMWVYGGMTDLQERNDLWKWCTVSKAWFQFKSKHNPGPLHSHAVCKLPGSMLLFGGESGGQPTNDLWKFTFDFETWEKIQIIGLKPQPRAESIAFSVSEFLLKFGSVPKELPTSASTKSLVRPRPRTSASADRTTARHSSYIPQNRVTPSEKTYVFQPTTNNYTDGSDESFHKSLVSNSNTTYKSAQPGGFLREIQKLSQLNLSKLSHNKCSYSVLNATESTESLLRQPDVPIRMVKSQSEHFSKRFNCQISPEVQNIPKTSRKSCKPTEMKREPISVPNFSTLILPTPVLTPVEAAKLVYLDSEDEADLQDDDGAHEFYDTFKPACRDESYSSHLCASIYQNIPKSASVKFQCPELEEVSETSDYASVQEVMNKTSTKKGILKQTPTDGPFGFANPHYMGPDIQDFLKSKDSKAQQYAKLLNTPDSGVGDMSVSKSSTSRFLMEDVEMQQLDTRVNNERNTQAVGLTKRFPPNTLTLNTGDKKVVREVRASSSSRVERVRDKTAVTELSTQVDEANVQLYVFVIGGKEQGQITVFKRPISIWRLKLY